MLKTKLRVKPYTTLAGEIGLEEYPLIWANKVTGKISGRPESCVYNANRKVHLHLLSDSPIQKGDWFIDLGRSSYSNKPYLCDIGNTETFILTKDVNFPFPLECKKIEASTDPSLGIPGIPKSWIENVYLPSKGTVPFAYIRLVYRGTRDGGLALFVRNRVGTNNVVMVPSKSMFSLKEMEDCFAAGAEAFSEQFKGPMAYLSTESVDIDFEKYLNTIK